MLREIKKKAAIYGILAVLIATTLGVVSLNFGVRPSLFPASVSALGRFSSHEELENFLVTNQKTPDYHFAISDLPRVQLPSGTTPDVTYWGEILGGVDAEAIVPRSGPEYSLTNVQVAGVDEADWVKTDGEYMYIISGNNITILRAYPAEDAEILSKITFNGTLRGIFINGDKLAVFGEAYFYQPVEAFYVANITVKTNETTTFAPLQVRILPYPMYSAGGETFVKIYNVSDRTDPLLTRDFTINGTYFNSRMIGDYVYAVTNQPTLWHDYRVVLPMITSLGETKTIQPNEIYYSNVSDNSYAFTTIVAINLRLDETEPVHKTFLLGSATCMYVSLNNIYMTMPKSFSTNTEATLVYRVRIREGEIESEAGGEVPGRVLNQFSMDEYGDENGEYFRIATTIGQVWSSERPSQNNLYVLDLNLDIIGRLEDLAPGERIYSARFMGDRCYLVTFKKVDPLFVIDLEDPTNPTVLGQLKITGYSDYLHPYDGNHLLGIGKEAVEDEEGDFAWYQGVKISLFDVSDVENPKEIAKYEIGDRGTESPVLRDHKALLFDKARNLFVIPVLVAEINEDKYPGGVPPNIPGDYVWQGAYIFNITIEQGFDLRGRVTHLENDGDLKKSGYYFYSSYSVKRSLYIGNVLYTISDKKVKMNLLSDLSFRNEVELP